MEGWGTKMAASDSERNRRAIRRYILDVVAGLLSGWGCTFALMVVFFYGIFEFWPGGGEWLDYTTSLNRSLIWLSCTVVPPALVALMLVRRVPWFATGMLAAQISHNVPWLLLVLLVGLVERYRIRPLF